VDPFSAAGLAVKLAKVILVVSRPHLLLRLCEIRTAVLEKPDPVIPLALGHVRPKAFLNLLDLVSDGLEPAVIQETLDLLLRACVRLGDGTAECEVEVVSVSLYVALAAVRIVRPQLGQNATSSARLRIFIRTEVAHAARLAVARAPRLGAELARRTAIALRLAQLVHAAPDVILSLVGEVSSTMVARLSAGARADIVTLLLAPVADVRQNDRVEVAFGAPAVGGGWGVTRMIAARVARVAIVGPENCGA
jgi:hypothetical protein